MIANEKISPIHPGEHLAEFLAEMEITQYRLATAIHVPPRRINEIVHGRRGITADTALRLGKFFGTSAQYWMSLQDKYELESAMDEIGGVIERDIAQFA